MQESTPQRFVKNIADFPKFQDKDIGLSEGYIAKKGGVLYMVKSAPKSEFSAVTQSRAWTTEVFVEQIFADIMRNLLNKRAPQIYLAVDDNNAYTISRYMTNFKTSLDISEKNDDLKGVKGFESLLVTSALCGDVDFGVYNTGVIVRKDGSKVFAKIDHGRAGSNLPTAIDIGVLFSSDLVCDHEELDCVIDMKKVQRNIKNIAVLPREDFFDTIVARVGAMEQQGVLLNKVFNNIVLMPQSEDAKFMPIVVKHFMDVITTNRAALLQFYRNSLFVPKSGLAFSEVCEQMICDMAAEYCGEYAIYLEDKEDEVTSAVDLAKPKKCEIIEEAISFITSSELEIGHKIYALNIAQKYLGSPNELQKKYEMTDMHLWAHRRSEDKLEALGDLDYRKVNVQDYRGNTPLFYLLQNFVYNEDGISLASIRGFSGLYPDVSIQNRAGETALDYFLSYLRVSCQKLRYDERSDFLLAHFADVLPYFYFDKTSLMQVTQSIPKELLYRRVMSGVLAYMAFLNVGHEVVAEIMGQYKKEEEIQSDALNEKVKTLISELGMNNTLIGGAVIGTASDDVLSPFITTDPNSLMGRAIKISAKLERCKGCFQDQLKKPLWDCLPNIASIINGHREPALIEGALDVCFNAFHKKVGVDRKISKADTYSRYNWSEMESDPMLWLDRYMDTHYRIRHEGQVSK